MVAQREPHDGKVKPYVVVGMLGHNGLQLEVEGLHAETSLPKQHLTLSEDSPVWNEEFHFEIPPEVRAFAPLPRSAPSEICALRDLRPRGLPSPKPGCVEQLWHSIHCDAGTGLLQVEERVRAVSLTVFDMSSRGWFGNRGSDASLASATVEWELVRRANLETREFTLQLAGSKASALGGGSTLSVRTLWTDTGRCAIHWQSRGHHEEINRPSRGNQEATKRQSVWTDNGRCARALASSPPE